MLDWLVLETIRTLWLYSHFHKLGANVWSSYSYSYSSYSYPWIHTSFIPTSYFTYSFVLLVSEFVDSPLHACLLSPLPRLPLFHLNSSKLRGYAEWNAYYEWFVERANLDNVEECRNWVFKMHIWDIECRGWKGDSDTAAKIDSKKK